MQSAVSIPLPNIRFLQIEQSKFPNWLIYLFVATVFSKEIGSLTIAGIDYDMIGYSFCIIYFLRYLRGLYLNSSLNYFLFFLLCSSLIAKAYLNLSLSPLFKQWIPFALIFLVNYDFFARTANLKRIFKAYITVSYYTAIIGILQLGLKFFFGIKFRRKPRSSRRVRRFVAAHSASNHGQAFLFRIVIFRFGACTLRRFSIVESNKSKIWSAP